MAGVFLGCASSWEKSNTQTVLIPDIEDYMEFSNCYGCRVKNLASTQATASLPWHYFNPSQITFLVFKMKDFEKTRSERLPARKIRLLCKISGTFRPNWGNSDFFFAWRVRNPGLWDPWFHSRNPESRQRLESGIPSSESSVQDCLGLTCMGRHVYFSSNISSD